MDKSTKDACSSRRHRPHITQQQPQRTPPFITRLIGYAAASPATPTISSPTTQPTNGKTVINNSNSNNEDDDQDEDEDDESVNGDTMDDGLPLPLPPQTPIPPFHLSHILAGIGAGLITAVLMTPFDVIRTRLAVQEKTTIYRGLIGSFRTTWREEGMRGLYRGFGPTLVVVPLFWSMYMPAYASFKHKLEAHESLHAMPRWSKHLIAAVSAGALADVIVNPLFVVRTRLQTQHMRLYHSASNPHGIPNQVLYHGTLNTLKRMIHEEGVASLFRGLSASFLGLTHVMIQFPVWEYLKVALPAAHHAAITTPDGQDRFKATIEAFTQASHTSYHYHQPHSHPHVKSSDSTGSSLPPHSSPSHPHHQPPGTIHLIGASMFSKIIASVITFPHEVLRSRLQNAPVTVFSGLQDCALKTIRHEGVGALYKVRHTSGEQVDDRRNY